jgi:hypothetical protein
MHIQSHITQLQLHQVYITIEPGMVSAGVFSAGVRWMRDSTGPDSCRFVQDDVPGWVRCNFFLNGSSATLRVCQNQHADATEAEVLKDEKIIAQLSTQSAVKTQRFDYLE